MIAVIGLILACSCSTLSGGSTPVSPGNATPLAGNGSVIAGGTAAPTENFPLPPNPITVHAVLDTAHTFSNARTAWPGVAYMSQIGGQTDAGVGFSLQLPGGLLALDADGNMTPAFGTTVTVTPVSAIPDIPSAKGTSPPSTLPRKGC